MSKKSDKRKLSIYVKDDVMLEEIVSEAHRQGRSIAWVMLLAWKMARDKIKSIPTPER